jgi:hypothetical protein
MSDRKQDEARPADAAGRRQFLRSILQFGGAAALLLTDRGRDTLARSLSLDPADRDAARRARLTAGAPAGCDSNTTLEAANRAAGCDGCAGQCSGCTSCTGCTGCGGQCSNTCKGSNN